MTAASLDIPTRSDNGAMIGIVKTACPLTDGTAI